MVRERGSVQISIRIPSGLLDRVDMDLERYCEHVTCTEFIIDALKFFLEHRVESKLRERELDTMPESPETKIGGRV